MNRIPDYQDPEFDPQASSRSHSQVAIIFWLFILFAALCLYAYWNQPLRRSLINLLPLPTALFFVLSSTGYGTLLRRWIPESINRTIQFLTYSAIGIGMTGLFVFCIGLFGQIKGWLLLSWTLLGFLFFVRRIFREKFPPIKTDWNIWNLLGAFILVAFLVQTVPFVASPEVTTDALEYHLLIPKIYIGLGKINYIPLLVGSNYPSLAEYNFLPVLKLASEIVCKGFHFWIGILLLLLLGQLVKSLRPDVAHLPAPAFFLAMPVTSTLMGWAWNDLLFTFFVVLCLSYLIQYQATPDEPRRNLSLILAGVMAGLASWTKYTFMMFFIALIVFYLIAIWRWKWEWKKFGFILIPVILISILWSIKNWVFTGNPVYPFLNDIFQSPYWTPAADHYFKGALTRSETPDWNWTTYFLFPFLITLKPIFVDVHTGILPLLLLPLLFINNRSRGVSMLKLYLVAYVLVWLFIQTVVRSLLSVFAVIFCVGTISLQEFLGVHSKLRTVAILLILGAAGANYVITIASTYYLFNPIPYFIGKENKAQYLSKYAASQPTYDYLNTTLAVHRILLVGHHNPFYLNRPYFFSSSYDPPVAEVLSADTKTPEEFQKKLKKLGITHVALNPEEYERENSVRLYSWSAEKRAMFETFLSRYCHPEARFGRDQVLRLND